MRSEWIRFLGHAAPRPRLDTCADAKISNVRRDDLKKWIGGLVKACNGGFNKRFHILFAQNLLFDQSNHQSVKHKLLRRDLGKKVFRRLNIFK